MVNASIFIDKTAVQVFFDLLIMEIYYLDIKQNKLTMENTKYSCPKCNNNDYLKDEFRATGGFWTKIFDVQNKHFTTVTCTRCKYTEIYKVKSSKLENVFDFFTN